jgi:type IV secretion system protein VirB5
MPRLAFGRSHASSSHAGSASSNGHPVYHPTADAPGGASGAPANPWVDAVQHGRREWAGAFGDLAKSRRNWQLVAFCALGIAGVASTGLVALATTSRITPYVVEVDKLGRAQAFGPATRLAPADQRVVQSQIATWIRDIRAVLGDPIAQADLVRRAYAFVDQNTAGFLQSYFTDPARDPRVIARDLTRVVEVTSILPVPGAANSAAARGAVAAPTTWKVSWTETDYPRGGGTPTVAAWEAYITTHQVPPTSPDRVEVNPLGLYVSSVSWTQVTTRQPVNPPPGSAGATPAAAAPLPTITSPPLVNDPGAAPPAALAPAPRSPSPQE